MFKFGREHRTLEGTVIAGFFAAIAVWWVWKTMEPLVYRVFPELGATREGPAPFPVTVHLGADNIQFTNGSADAWRCEAKIVGAGIAMANSHALTFPLAPGERRELAYGAFTVGSPPPDIGSVRRAARNSGEIQCVEPSGIVHFWAW